MTRTIDPLVSTDRLAADLGLAGGAAGSRDPSRAPAPLVILDVREPHLYAAGHIPGAINSPFSPMSDWAISTDELLMELPDDADLLAAIGALGLSADSRVVIVTTVDTPPAPPFSLSDGTRVAATLVSAGVEDVAILDGGHPKWEREGRGLSTDIPAVSPTTHTSTVDRESWVSTEYVEDRIGRAVILDGRDAHEYFGAVVCPFAGKRGHVPSARSLPVPWMWNEDGTYRPLDLLRDMAAGVAGPAGDQEIIVYCGVGGYASSLWFLLTRMLGYTNVKIYDGAAEAWAKDHDMVTFTWTA